MTSRHESMIDFRFYRDSCNDFANTASMFAYCARSCGRGNMDNRLHTEYQNDAAWAAKIAMERRFAAIDAAKAIREANGE